MAEIINQDYRNRKLAIQDQLKQLPDTALDALISQKQKDTMPNRIGNAVMAGANTFGDIMLARGGVKMPESQGSDLNDFIAKERIRQEIENQDPYRQAQIKSLERDREWKPTTREEALQFEREKNALKGDNLTPMQKRIKLKQTYDLKSLIENNSVKRQLLKNAEDSLSKIPQGMTGKIKMDYLKNFDPTNPLLTDWQNVKMVLTDVQLMNTALTKGAISDREMELFAKAAANDDVSSIARIRPVLNKLKMFMDAEEKAGKESYVLNYGHGIDDAEAESMGQNVDTASQVETANPTATIPTQTEQPKQAQDIRSQYNALRESGMSAEEAKKRLGL